MEESINNHGSIGKGTLKFVLRSQGKHLRELGGQINKMSIPVVEAWGVKSA